MREVGSGFFGDFSAVRELFCSLYKVLNSLFLGLSFGSQWKDAIFSKLFQ